MSRYQVRIVFTSTIFQNKIVKFFDTHTAAANAMEYIFQKGCHIMTDSDGKVSTYAAPSQILSGHIETVDD